MPGLIGRHLSTRDRRLVEGVDQDPAERFITASEDTRPDNVAELLGEIDRAKDPKAKAVLVEEYNRIMANQPLKTKPTRSAM